MNKADLKDVKHKIITFELKILEGKISDDSKTKDEVKPVRPLGSIFFIGMLVCLFKFENI